MTDVYEIAENLSKGDTIHVNSFEAEFTVDRSFSSSTKEDMIVFSKAQNHPHEGAVTNVNIAVAPKHVDYRTKSRKGTIRLTSWEGDEPGGKQIEENTYDLKKLEVV